MYTDVRDAKAAGFLSTKPTMIVTTRHESGIVNAGVFGAYTNVSSDQVGVAMSVKSHSYANSIRTGEFVINVPGADLVQKLAILAENVPPERSELDDAKLTTREAIMSQTPSIAQCAAAVELRFEQDIPIGTHHFVIGRVTGGWIRTELMDDDGKINIFKARVLKDFKYPKPLYFTPGEVVEG